ncbi:MAG: 16S rRNA (cytosine(1402)-N(4))-methyltransferase RsmH [Candidatus Magasanikbacteria bacterium]|nr:16S rRNA (cytosine(1402)-N(4))-methyltransferase RsmH [Candidatus Magasanikbacteria bacterium]
MSQSIHIAVMLEETMLGLEPHDGGVYVDGTLGGATHTRELLKRSAPTGRVYSFDVDPQALLRAKETLTEYGDRWQGIEANFRAMADSLRERGVNSVDGILLDLGFSSDEISDPKKGLSFQLEGPLDMRLGPKANEDGLTAADIVNTWKVTELTEMIRNFGEEKFAFRIATAIADARRVSRITRTIELAGIIKAAVPANYEQGRIHPATRTFQALRMAVNDEIQSLKQAIESAYSILAPNGRLAIISFHSIEDRVVKLALKDEEKWSNLYKRPLTPGEQELTENPRSRSAKLRIATKNEPSL